MMKFLITIFLLLSFKAFSITENDKDIKPAFIAVMPIFDTDGTISTYGEKVREIIIKEITNYALLKTSNEDTFAEITNFFNVAPEYKDWQATSTQFIFSAEIDETDEGIELAIGIDDVLNETIIEALKITQPNKEQIEELGIYVTEIIFETIIKSEYFKSKINLEDMKTNFLQFVYKEPTKALDIINELAKYEIDLELLDVYEIDEYLVNNQHCLSAGVDNFDEQELFNEIGINEEENFSDPYDINFFIEDIHNNKLNITNHKLKALQLFCKKGEGSGAEIELVIDFLYESWKNENDEEFEFCNWITSGFASTICTNRAIEEQKIVEQEVLNSFKSKFDSETAASIDELYVRAKEYFTGVASKETHLGHFSLRPTYIMNDVRERELELNKILQSNELVFNENLILSNEELDKYFEDIINSIEIFGTDSEYSKYLNTEFDKEIGYNFYKFALEETQNSFNNYKNILINVLKSVKPDIKSIIIENNLNYNRKNELYSIHRMLTPQYFDREDNPYCSWAESQEEKYNNCFIYKDENQYYIESSFNDAYLKSKQYGYNFFWWNEKMYSTE